VVDQIEINPIRFRWEKSSDLIIPARSFPADGKAWAKQHDRRQIEVAGVKIEDLREMFRAVHLQRPGGVS
jgi:hypothetical protein